MTWELHEGDCLDVMPEEIKHNSVDSIVTDPPFKISQQYSSNADADNLIAVSGILLAAKEMARIAVPGALAAVFYDTRILPLALYAFNKAGWKYLRGLTFYRRWGNAHKLSGWMSTSDFILLFVNPGAKYEFNGPWRHDVYIKDKPEEHSFEHPAQKPISCVEHIIENITPLGGTVLDPYAGIGTVGVAAENCKRNSVMIEKESDYCNIIRKRMDNMQQNIFSLGVSE